VGSAAKAIDYDPAVIGARLWTSFFFAWLAILSAYLVFIGGGWPGIYSVELRTASLDLIATVLAVWFIIALVRSDWRPRSRILPGLLACLVALAASTALSRQPRLGYDYLAYSVLLVVLYLLLVRILANPWMGDRLMAIVVVLAIGVGAAYAIQVGGLWFDWWSMIGRLAAPPLRPGFASLSFGNPSAVMTVSILLALPAIAHLGFRPLPRAIASGVTGGLALFCTLISGSRAGWIALGLGLIVTGGIWLAFSANRTALTRFIRSRRLMYALGAGAATSVLIALVTIPGILLRTGAGGEGLRLAFFGAALRMFSESPIHGTGLGTWVAQRVTYTESPASDFYIPHAHNIFLQTLAESGLIGAAAGGLLAWQIARLVLRSIRVGSGASTWMAWAAVLSLAYFASHQLLDFYANMPAAMFAAVIPIAWLDARASSEDPPSGRARSDQGRATLMGSKSLTRAVSGGSLVGIAALSVIATVWLTVSEGWAAMHAQAVGALNAGKNSEALEPARAAARSDPNMPAYQFTLGIAESRAGNQTNAAAAFARAAAFDDLPETWLDLAAIQASLGNTNAASASLSKATRLGSIQPAVAVAAGDLYARIGDSPNAILAFKTALKGTPSLAGDKGFAELVAHVIDPNVLVDGVMDELGPVPASVEIAAEANRQEDAEAIIGQLPSDQQGLMTLVVAAWFGDADALRQVRELAVSSPLDASLVSWRARLDARFGDVAGAESDRTWFQLIYGSTAESVYEERLDSVPSNPSGNSGTTSPFYGHFTYRRPTPWNQIVDLVPHLTSR
jgi:O-antigen ligase/tetratricopeptide (TPR) repeat protein